MQTFFFSIVVTKGIGQPPNFPFLGRGKLDGHSIQFKKQKLNTFLSALVVKGIGQPPNFLKLLMSQKDHFFSPLKLGGYLILFTTCEKKSIFFPH
jgi:hypothetical protein